MIALAALAAAQAFGQAPAAPVQGPVQGPVQEPVRGPVQGPVQEPVQEPLARPEPVTRQALAELVQQVDARLAAALISGSLEGEALAAANRRFDSISLRFFGGDLGAVRDELRAWVTTLEPAPARDAARDASRPEAAPAESRSLADLRGEVEAQLAHATIEDTGSLRVLQSRLALLVDAPSPERSREFLWSSPALAEAVRGEAQRLLAGERPYANVVGDLWRTVPHGRRDLAVRVYQPAPRGSAPVHAAPLPLVVAFHGAGGDENFLFELAGDGYLKRLADEYGFLVVCPFTPDYTFGGPAFDSLLAALSADYSIDPARVFLLGHSMGGATVSNLCRLRPRSFARAACVAGFGKVGAGSPPVLVVSGALDPIVPTRGLARSVEASRAAGADVRLEVLEHQGHTLLLPVAMRRAIADFGLQAVAAAKSGS
ncbi:MAG: hypothetical protein R3F49_21860 [Planctomycetota bacterium]